MTDEIQMLEALEARAVRREGRRAFFKAAIGAAAVGAGGFAAASAVQAATAPTELDVLNFALNLEYLEANYYAFAVTGNPIDPTLTASGSGTAGVAATGGTKANLTDPYVIQMAAEIAADELAHVKFLRAQLKTAAAAQPPLDLGTSATSAFSVAAQKAGVVAAGVAFNPYLNDETFLLGAFLFEDVGATAYQGAVAALTTADYIKAAGGILSVEAQHAAAIRTTLYSKGISTTTPPTLDLIGSAGKISNARDTLAGGEADQGITSDDTATGAINFDPLDATKGAVFGRTTQQILKIVYLNNAVATSGGFFPSGMTGNIKSTAA